jgi:hypothetical protein
MPDGNGWMIAETSWRDLINGSVVPWEAGNGDCSAFEDFQRFQEVFAEFIVLDKAPDVEHREE